MHLFPDAYRQNYSDNDQLYGCGLNNRGQLGLGSLEEKVTTPVLIDNLSHDLGDSCLSKKTSRGRISSVYYNEMKK